MATSDLFVTQVTPADDETLLREIQQGAPKALASLFDRYGGVLKALILRIVHDDGEADDLLGEVFMEIWRKATTYSPQKGKPLGWMVTLARRRAIDRLRKRIAYGHMRDRFSVIVDADPEAQSNSRVEAEIGLHDLHVYLTAQLKRLPPLQRQALELAYFAGMSQREIARVTDTPLGTVKTRLELGMRKLSEATRGLKDMI